MATPTPASAPTQTPPQPSVAAQAARDIAAVKTKHDYLRPLRYIKNFIGGTLTDGLDSMSFWGRTGFKAGVVGGIIAGIGFPLAAGGIATAITGVAIGLAVGAIAGGTYGFLTGGYRAVARQRRGEVYAEDLVRRKEMQQSAAPNRADYRAAHNARLRHDAEVQRQVIARNDENTADFARYWQDRVGSGHSNGSGVGF